MNWIDSSPSEIRSENLCGTDKMASLRASNPHAISVTRKMNDVSNDSPSMGFEFVRSRWRSTSGEAISDDSKLLLSVVLGKMRFILADVRFVDQSKSPDGRVLLEFFFDGEMSDISQTGLKQEFICSLGDSITRGVQEHYRRRFSFDLDDAAKRAQIKGEKFPDTTVLPIAGDLDGSFRDAGCMLSFIAVKVYLSEECSRSIGGIVFPEIFIRGFRESTSKEPVPKWIIGMGITTVVVGFATMYAWAQILFYGNDLN